MIHDNKCLKWDSVPAVDFALTLRAHTHWENVQGLRCHFEDLEGKFNSESAECLNAGYKLAMFKTKIFDDYIGESRTLTTIVEVEPEGDGFVARVYVPERGGARWIETGCSHPIVSEKSKIDCLYKAWSISAQWYGIRHLYA